MFPQQQSQVMGTKLDLHDTSFLLNVALSPFTKPSLTDSIGLLYTLFMNYKIKLVWKVISLAPRRKKRHKPWLQAAVLEPCTKASQPLVCKVSVEIHILGLVQNLQPEWKENPTEKSFSTQRKSSCYIKTFCLALNIATMQCNSAIWDFFCKCGYISWNSYF